MAELLEHPLVSKVREYMDSPNHDAQCAELVEMLSSISVATDELERAIVDVPAAEIDRNRLRHDLGRLLNTQVAMWDALGYLPERKHPHELRQTFVRVMHDVGALIETVAFKADDRLAAELENRLASLPTHVTPDDDWRDLIDAV